MYDVTLMWRMTRIDSVLYDLNPIPKSLNDGQFDLQKIQRWPVGELFAQFSGYNTRGYLIEQDNKSIYLRNVLYVQVLYKYFFVLYNTLRHYLSLYICMYVCNVLVIE